MKYIIILILFFTCNVYGQKKDTLVNLSLKTERSYIISFDFKQPKPDTIKCIMLLCDTLYYIPNLYVQFGYEVHEKVFVPAHQESANNGDAIMLYDDEWVDKFRGYLDENKNPLKKSTIVWMSKEIKP